MKLKGFGPIKLGSVHEQLDFDRLVKQYYVKFAGSFILIAEEFLW